MTLASRTILTLSAAALSIIPTAARAADTYTADPAHASVVFRVKHMNTSYVWGRFNSIAGSFALDQADPSQSKMAFTIKTASVDTNNTARDNHLKGPDFFSAVQYPNVTFVSESVSKSAKGYDVQGTLTFHGVSKPMTILVTPTGMGKDMKGTPIAGIEASFVIKQSDFGITKMAAAIGDDVNVFVSIEGTKK